MIKSSVKTDLELVREYVLGVRGILLADGVLLKNELELGAIKQDLTRIVRLVVRSCLSVVASLRGALATNYENCFDILALEEVIDADLAKGIYTAVHSWVLLETGDEELDGVVVQNFCRCFLADFDEYAQALLLAYHASQKIRNVI